MGACYDDREFKIDTKFSLKKASWIGVYNSELIRNRFRHVQEDDRYENGVSYSGTIGMADGLEFRTDKLFKSYTDAADWLQGYAEKWGPAVAVRYILNNQQYILIGAICSS